MSGKHGYIYLFILCDGSAVCAHTYHGTHMEVGRQLAEVSSLHPPWESLSSGHWPSHQLSGAFVHYIPILFLRACPWCTPPAGPISQHHHFCD